MTYRWGSREFAQLQCQPLCKPIEQGVTAALHTNINTMQLTLTHKQQQLAYQNDVPVALHARFLISACLN